MRFYLISGSTTRNRIFFLRLSILSFRELIFNQNFKRLSTGFYYIYPFGQVSNENRLCRVQVYNMTRLICRPTVYTESVWFTIPSATINFCEAS